MNKTFFVPLIVLMFVVILGVYFFVPKHCSHGFQEDVYYIDQDYDRVRKILTRTDSLEEIVSRQHGEVLHQKWNNLNVSSEKLLGPWDISGSGEFIVRSEDPETGTLLLQFNQTINIGKDTLVSKSSLSEPVGHLKEYNAEMTMVRDGNRTKVTNSISLRYERRLPTGYIDYMNEKVDQAAIRSLNKSREAILALVNRYDGKRFILPIK